MSKPVPPVVSHCAELLAPLGRVRFNRMFGGHGFYLDELFIALVLDERFYLKVDEETRSVFIGAGCAPFEYEREGKTASIGYYTAPAEAMESPALMEPWARLAIGAALRARAARKKPAAKRSAGKRASVKTAAKSATAKRASAKRARPASR